MTTHSQLECDRCHATVWSYEASQPWARCQIAIIGTRDQLVELDLCHRCREEVLAFLRSPKHPGK